MAQGYAIAPIGLINAPNMSGGRFVVALVDGSLYDPTRGEVAPRNRAQQPGLDHCRASALVGSIGPVELRDRSGRPRNPRGDSNHYAAMARQTGSNGVQVRVVCDCRGDAVGNLGANWHRSLQSRTKHDRVGTSVTTLAQVDAPLLRDHFRHTYETYRT